MRKGDAQPTRQLVNSPRPVVDGKVYRDPSAHAERARHVVLDAVGACGGVR